MNKAEFVTILPQVITREVSVDPGHWTAENPFWGTCVPVSLLANDVFGGELLRSPLDPIVYFTSSHYWNRLPNGEEYDFSESQFQGSKPILVGEKRTREYLLTNSQSAQRYYLLKSLFENFRANGE